MDPITILNNIVSCWDRTAEYRKYISSLGDKLTDLKGKTDELGHVYIDVNRLVVEAEAEGWVRKSDAKGWLERVETLRKEAKNILEDGNKTIGRSCFCGICFVNCRARYRQSKLAEEKGVILSGELDKGRCFRVKGDVAYEPADLALEKSLQALRDKTDELRDVFETVQQRVQREEERHMVLTPEVGGWLERVEDLLEKKVPEILEKGELELEKSSSRMEDESKSLRNLPSCSGISKRANEERDTLEPLTNDRNLPSYSGISKRANEERAALEDKLLQGRGFTVFTCKPADPMILELPLERPVGVESAFNEVWSWVEDETVRCIGIFGMGGVGKTVLLDSVHNQFARVTHSYNFALRVVVSRPLDLDKIQEAVLKKTKLPSEEWVDLDRISRASVIRRLLMEKDFLLFLDDLWDPIDLNNDVGIPCDGHPKKCKIIFTTRQVGVCNRMRADKTKKVECLPPEEAVRLFQQKLGERTWVAHPRIPEIAARFVHECKYLPLAIVTAARAMVGTTEIQEWEEAEKDLKSRASKFPDMEKEVLAKLEFSYERLPDKTHRKCFLYLAIFPEDYRIPVADAIDLWIGEGLLDECGSDNVHESRSYGENIFRKLEHACLVEPERFSFLREKSVKMHDAVREMAKWVASEHGQKRNKVIVQEKVEPSLLLGEFKKWKDAETVSLWRVGLPNSFPRIECPNLSTLILRGAPDLRRVPDTLLPAMPFLKVLDVSHNIFLAKLPDNIGQLIHLQYLKLDFTGVKQLPLEVKKLTKLMVLILPTHCECLLEVIPNLSNIRVFRQTGKAGKTMQADVEFEMLQVLHRQGVEEIYTELPSAQFVEKLLRCPDLLGHFRMLRLDRCEGLTSLRVPTASVRRMEHFQVLRLQGLEELSEIKIGGEPERARYGPDKPPRGVVLRENCFPKLANVYLWKANRITDLTSLIYHAPNLETLIISECQSLTEVVSGDTGTAPAYFSCLTHLDLGDLPKLEIICPMALPFDTLQAIKVANCPALKKLPLARDSAKYRLHKIKGTKRWWEDLKWDHDPAAEQVFASKFVEVDIKAGNVDAIKRDFLLSMMHKLPFGGRRVTKEAIRR